MTELDAIKGRVARNMDYGVEMYYVSCADFTRLCEMAELSERLKAELVKEERACLQSVTERDSAEESLSQAYYLVTGRSPEWSNLFGQSHALNEIDEALTILRSEAKACQALRTAMAKEKEKE